jgi:hypothetical protein
MTTLNTTTATLVSMATGFDQAEMAAGAYLARYSGRTLETYRYDVRTFQWCADVGLGVLEVKRAHIELWRAAMEERGLAGLDDRPAPLDHLRLLSLRPHRRSHRRQPGPVRATAQGLPQRGSGSRPGRTRHIPLHG